jgi:hypothetical protein
MRRWPLLWRTGFELASRLHGTRDDGRARWRLRSSGCGTNAQEETDMLGLIMIAALAGGADMLRAAAVAATGRPPLLDPRTAVPACPGGFGFGAAPPAAAAVKAHCAATGWTMTLPLGDAGPSRGAREPLVKRGDPVRVRARGAGFEARIEGVALSGAAAGAPLRVKLPQGRQIVVRVQEDGSLLLGDAE